MNSIGVPGLILLLVLALVLFGPKKLPELGRAVGHTLKEFKNATRGLTKDDEDEQPAVAAAKAPAVTASENHDPAAREKLERETREKLEREIREKLEREQLEKEMREKIEQERLQAEKEQPKA